MRGSVPGHTGPRRGFHPGSALPPKGGSATWPRGQYVHAAQASPSLDLVPKL